MVLKEYNMESTINAQPHRRYNILTDEWVLVSPHRNKRPWQGKTVKSVTLEKPKYDENCYLCPTNQRASAETNPDYKGAYSFINDFSALLPDTEKNIFKNGLLKATSESGICKVVCFSPNHSLTLPLMSVSEISEVISLWKTEYTELAAHPHINHVQIFENKGDIMGCSNPHPHGQIWAQESIPEMVLKKQVQQQKYWNTHNKSLLSDYVQQEIELDERIILKNEYFVALVPFWAVWPYETMIVPKVKKTSILELDDNETLLYAEAISVITKTYDKLFNTSFPYSSGIHQAPTDEKNNSHWHFHMSFYPPLLRSATVKKFMVGYEMFGSPQRDITAEQAVKTLRDLL